MTVTGATRTASTPVLVVGGGPAGLAAAAELGGRGVECVVIEPRILLVDAGLSAVDALRAATIAPARYFGLTDRGVIEPGRADLVLIDGDPVHDIRATLSVSRVWCGGVEHVPA